MLVISLKKAHKLVGDIRRVPNPSPSMMLFPQQVNSIEDVSEKSKQYEEMYSEYISNGIALQNVIAKIRAEIAAANHRTHSSDGKSILDLMAEIAHVRSIMDRLSMFSIKSKRTHDNDELVFNSIMSARQNEHMPQTNIHMAGVSSISEEVHNQFFKQHKELSERHDVLRDTLTALNSSTEITIELSEEETKLLDSFGLI